MFCVNCGNILVEGQNFCRNCGNPVKRPGAAGQAAAYPAQAAAVLPQVPAPPPQAPMQASAPQPARSAMPGGRCSWCGSDVFAGQSTCPRCGAALDHPPAVTAGGWTELPGRKDMTKLQIGNSSCQIEGLYVPVADMNLAAGDSVYFTHHVLLWKDPQVNVTTMPLKGGFKRLLAGMPLIMTQAQGPGHIAFSKDDPGELIPVALQPGQSIDVREHMLLAATSNVTYDWFSTNVYFETRNGDEREVFHPVGAFMDRFSASTPGLLLLHAGGNVFIRQLAPGQTVLVKPTALVFKDPTVDMNLHFEHPRTNFVTWGRWSNMYFWLRLTGPGRVAIQSVFPQIEGEARNITGWSDATEARW
ncbi:MAG TPA: AIM24 family protein [Bryobacteraceae bacterium]|nr:AIM24 family protein [Bryobacteraceae bacterium]